MVTEHVWGRVVVSQDSTLIVSVAVPTRTIVVHIRDTVNMHYSSVTTMEMLMLTDEFLEMKTGRVAS